MQTIKIVAFALIALGVLALAYGGFTYTRDTHEAKIGPIEVSVSDRQRVNVPVWAGLGAVLIGGLLLFAGSKRGQS